jgi:hypothetical protein
MLFSPAKASQREALKRSWIIGKKADPLSLDGDQKRYERFELRGTDYTDRTSSIALEERIHESSSESKSRNTYTGGRGSTIHTTTRPLWCRNPLCHTMAPPVEVQWLSGIEKDVEVDSCNTIFTELNLKPFPSGLAD